MSTAPIEPSPQAPGSITISRDFLSLSFPCAFWNTALSFWWISLNHVSLSTQCPFKIGSVATFICGLPIKFFLLKICFASKLYLILPRGSLRNNKDLLFLLLEREWFFKRLDLFVFFSFPVCWGQVHARQTLYLQHSPLLRSFMEHGLKQRMPGLPRSVLLSVPCQYNVFWRLECLQKAWSLPLCCSL